jgi:thiol:disulfide interchange protein DsbD
MIGVKYVFGLMLIAVAIWMVSPVLPAQAVMLGWGALGILCAVFAGVFSAMPDKMTIGGKFLRTFGLLLLMIGVLELVGAASGGSNALAPLSGLHASSGAASSGEAKKLTFKRIRTTEELDRELKSSGKPVMLDFYADWCVSCKEMEKFTFSDPKVQERLAGITLLQVDVTANTDADRALMKRFGLFGPPGMIFFDKTGQEIAECRVIGFKEPSQFLSGIGSVKSKE